MAKFKCDNPSCSNYGQEVTINEYKMKSNPFGYCYKNGGEIVCEQCKTPLSIIEEFDGFATARSLFSSRTPQEKKAILKRRANQHFKKNTDGMREYRDFMDEK